MEFYEKDFGKILKGNALEQRRAFLKSDSDCGRVYDRNLTQFPVTVDLYGKYVRITDFSDQGLSEEMRQSACDIASRMLYVESSKVVFQHRAKRAEGQQHGKQSDEALVLEVKENGISFKVDLTSRVDTGLFLDQEPNRRMVMDKSMGADVLNLFSYTGSFSVYAAKGGAKSVTSVDLSNTYTAWAVENLKRNGYAGDSYRCVAGDCLAFVQAALENRQKYDIIIFDPPSFSNSNKAGNFDVQKDYIKYFSMLYGLLRKGGFILFCTNLSGFQMDGNFRKQNRIKEITSAVRAQGFADRPGAVRSWILEKDDDRLTLRWDENSAPGRNTGSGKKPYGERRSYDGDRKPYYKDRDNYGDRKPYNSERRPYDGERSERKPYGEKRRSYDGDRKPYYKDRDSYGDRKPYNSERRPYDGERRSYDSERKPYGERRSYDGERKPYYRDRDNFGEKREYRERGSFDGEGKSYGGRNYRSDGRHTAYRDRSEGSAQNGGARGGAKPYGYDFKPAREKNESRQFFWLDEDEEDK